MPNSQGTTCPRLQELRVAHRPATPAERS
jgi:hypothetical protein